MAQFSANVAKMARILAITQILTGLLLFSIGIVDRCVPGGFTGYVYFGVWIGIWMCITGALGIPGSGRERSYTRNCFAGVFMGFSITSAVFGGIIIFFYSVGTSLIISKDAENFYDDVESYNKYYHVKVVILPIMLIMGIATFVIGIWAAICTCLLKPCCGQPQEGRYPADGYVIPPLHGGVPVAYPMQPGSGGPQDSHQPVALVPGAGASPGQHEIVQAASPEGMAAGTRQEAEFQSRLVNISPSDAMSTSTDSSPNETEIPRSFRHGGYALLKNEENQVDV